ncbi:MAG: phosphate signaling complex protein PhoU [Acidobacteria bacterium]|nr:MAG: phosphate signaling complex protein PhoU [Acidobacteriota bacterium]
MNVEGMNALPFPSTISSFLFDIRHSIFDIPFSPLILCPFDPLPLLPFAPSPLPIPPFPECVLRFAVTRTTTMPTHYEASLERDLNRIREKVRQMVDLASRALNDSVDAFLTANRPKAYLVVLRDQHIDELEREIDRLCLEFLVRQQPVASPLRFVYATIKINQDLERVGDYCESIARNSLKISHLNLHFLHRRYQEMAGIAIPMLRNAVRAFLEQDVDLARKTMQSESEVDRFRSVINNEVFGYQQGGRIPLEAMTPLLTIARRLERVSDQADNICEEVLYTCTGRYAKHQGADLFRVLLVDRNNSCLSQIAEAIGNSLQEPKFMFTSAGIDPAPLDSRMVEFLTSKGIDIARHSSKAIDQVPNLEYYQVVIAFGKETLNAIQLPAKSVLIDWNLPDPCAVQGTDEEVKAAYQKAHDFIEQHLRDLTRAMLGAEIEPTRIIGS